METEKTEEKAGAKQPMYGMHPMWRPWRGLWFVLGVVVIIGAICVMAAGMHRRVVAYGPVGGFEQGYRVQGSMGQPGMARGGMMGHGGGLRKQAGLALGIVTKIDGNTLTIRSRGVDTTVTVASTTSFYKADAVAKQADLQVSDVVSVQGTPDSSGNVQATQIIIQ